MPLSQLPGICWIFRQFQLLGSGKLQRSYDFDTAACVGLQQSRRSYHRPTRSRQLKRLKQATSLPKPVDDRITATKLQSDWGDDSYALDGKRCIAALLFDLPG